MPSKKSLQANARTGSITVSVTGTDGSTSVGGPIVQASVSVYSAPAGLVCDTFEPAQWVRDDSLRVQTALTNGQGEVRFGALAPALYVVAFDHHPLTDAECVAVDAGCNTSVCLHPDLQLDLTLEFQGPDCQTSACAVPRVGDRLIGTVNFLNNADKALTDHVGLVLPAGATRLADRSRRYSFTLPLRSTNRVLLQTGLSLDPLADAPTGTQPAVAGAADTVEPEAREPAPVAGNISVSMTRSETEATPDLLLWGVIRTSTDALSFGRYQRFMDLLFCNDGESSPAPAEAKAFKRLLKRRFLPFTDTDAYRVLKAATEAYVMVHCGVLVGAGGEDRDPEVLADLVDYMDRRDLPIPARGTTYLEQVDDLRLLPYLAIIRRKLPDVAVNDAIGGNDKRIELCDGFVREKLTHPCLLELIWSYWHEEAMQVQTMNAVMRRFQNVRGAHDPDPLANVEVNPLRPLNNMLWGYIQDEQHRLTVARRNYEYDHHYGLRLEGRAVRGFRPADTRSKFIEAFHQLLRLCTVFYRQDDDTTVKADAFGVLNALKEVHLILSEGAHNQFGDLPSTARVEMLMQQYLLARPEFREFLPTRVMVAYPEPWMDRVDAMKKLQGWTDTSVIHFHNLAVFGEQLLLSIRYGAWSTVFEPVQAFNFARFWRPQIQGYVHAYRAATGAELGAPTVSSGVDATLPSVLLQKRLAAQQRSV